MDLYQNFASTFEKIFPTNGRTVRSLGAFFPPTSRILDVGCGTGGYANALGKKGFTVVGIDSNPEMIDVANRVNRTDTVTFWPEDILEFDDDGTFDGAYCLDNVLPHLENRENVLEALKRIASGLCPKGKLLLQIINYDRILDQKIAGLPTILAEGGYEFRREYLFEGGMVRFHTLLKSPEKVSENSVILLPIRSEELVSLLEEAGFTRITLHEGFGRKPFLKESSEILTVTARKG